MLPYLLLFAGCAGLILAANLLVEGSAALARRMKASDLVIGLTVVAFGTSTPELVSSVLAVMKGSPEIVVGNVMGSNVTNILFILGLSAIVGKKMVTSYELANVDLPLFIGSAALLSLMVVDGIFSLAEALLCLALFLVYLLYAISVERVADEAMARSLEAGGGGHPTKRRLDPKVYLKLVLSVFFLYIGANYTIVSVVKLSEMVGIGIEIIAARKQFPEGPSKRPDLVDVIFSGGLQRKDDGTAILYAGISDAWAARVAMPDPFRAYE